MTILNYRRLHSDDEQWAPVSDLMAVIMLVFMLIAMILLSHFDLEKKNNIKKCNETKNMLDSEFRDDFKNWGAVLEEDLTIRFTNQRILFKSDSAEIEQGGWFARMLRNFFPRYMDIINDIQVQFGEKEIIAIRIEGHTSSEYNEPGVDSPFIKNMELSQNRAREILKYILDSENIPQTESYAATVYRLITANGLSSSKLICTDAGKEDRQRSRRVEFKLLTNSCQKAGIYDKVDLLTNTCLINIQEREQKNVR